ncbi:hypothetical protein NL676_000398 [Syzygium grande]|nr:hypothetical protein NL676_000398 [Syzygium grande]
MGNFVALFIGNCVSCISISPRQQGEVLQIVKLDGKIAKLTAPVLVKDLSTNLVYYVLPAAAAAAMSPERVPSTSGQSEQSDGVKKRIKIVITKQQLQQLLSKSVSVEEILAGTNKETCQDRGLDSPRNWRPRLDSIPEGRNVSIRNFSRLAESPSVSHFVVLCSYQIVTS